MTTLVYFAMGMAVCAWLALVSWCFIQAMERESWKMGVVTAIAICLPMAAAFADMDAPMHDPHAADLCLAGYQQWATSYRPPALVGKIVIPGGVYSHKVWVCTQWEAR